MNQEQITEKAKEVTSKVLLEMLNNGIYTVGDCYIMGPTVWDINRGWCKNWSLKMKDSVGKGKVINVRTLGLPVNHYVYKYKGLFYDAQNPEGVNRLNGLFSLVGLSKSGYVYKVFLDEVKMGYKYLKDKYLKDPIKIDFSKVCIKRKKETKHG